MRVDRNDVSPFFRTLLFGNSLNVVRYSSQEWMVQRQQKRTIFLLLAKRAAVEKKNPLVSHFNMCSSTPTECEVYGNTKLHTKKHVKKQRRQILSVSFSLKADCQWNLVSTFYLRSLSSLLSLSLPLFRSESFPRATHMKMTKHIYLFGKKTISLAQNNNKKPIYLETFCLDVVVDAVVVRRVVIEYIWRRVQSPIFFLFYFRRLSVNSHWFFDYVRKIHFKIEKKKWHIGSDTHTLAYHFQLPFGEAWAQ